MQTTKTFQPLIIIGAGRSGTNILRDVLCQLPGFGTWPCDEINYIWRHGNIRYSSDEFPPSLATESVRLFVHREFSKIANRKNLQTVVEKTCANSLRVGYLSQIFPEAKYVFIIRDGRDVVASAMKRWVEPLNIPYILPKIRYVPVVDIPYYAVRQLKNRVYRLASQEKRLAFWGPRFEGMDRYSQDHTLAQVCGMQWARCVDKAQKDISLIDPSRVFRLQYEDLATQPVEQMGRLLHFLDIDLSTLKIESLIQNISPTSIGKWKRDLKSSDLADIYPIIDPFLSQFGYE